MKASFLENTAIESLSVQLARLPGPHGYRLDGDTVHLNAMFALLDPAAHQRSWALQLWACPSAPVSAQDITGHIVAEVALPPIGELADEIEHFEVSAFARPPVGGREHVMALVLAAGRPGQFNNVHDFAVFSHREQFIQPRLSGNVGYRIDGARVQISVDRVENPRGATNRSGTLSLELWALPVTFTGRPFQGHHLAGVEIGSVGGQSELALQPIDVAFTRPPAGTWQIVLMLREWTAAGFVTRDFTNFNTPFISALAIDKPAVASVSSRPVAPAVVKTSVPVVASIPVAIVAKAVAPVIAAVPAKASAPEVAKAAAAASRAKTPGAAIPKSVAVNTAGVEELASVKGLSRKLAEGIVKQRPFVSLDDLRRVKGLGAKVLAKVRSGLKL